MSKTAIFLSRNRASVNAGVTQNYPAYNSNLISGNDNVVVARTAGVFSNLYIRIASNDRGASTYKFRKNGANGNQDVGSITGTGQFVDNSGTDSVSVGDKINTQLITGAGGTTFIPSVASMVFTATTGTVARFGATDHDPVSGTSTQYFYPFGGRMAVATTTEALSLMNVKIPGTYKNLGFNVTTNTRTDTTTVGIRLNGADSALKQTVPTLSSGIYYEDSSNNVAVTYENTTCMYILTGAGTGNFRIAQGFVLEQDTPSPHFQIFAGQGNGDLPSSASTTTYQGIGGQISASYTTESEVQTKMPFAMTLSGLQVRVSANGVTNDGTLRLRVNGANVNQVVPITGNATGLFQDTSLIGDYVLTDDLVDYQIVTGTAGTTTAIAGISILASLPVTRGFM